MHDSVIHYQIILHIKTISDTVQYDQIKTHPNINITTIIPSSSYTVNALFSIDHIHKINRRISYT